MYLFSPNLESKVTPVRHRFSREMRKGKILPRNSGEDFYRRGSRWFHFWQTSKIAQLHVSLFVSSIFSAKIHTNKISSSTSKVTKPFDRTCSKEYEITLTSSVTTRFAGLWLEVALYPAHVRACALCFFAHLQIFETKISLCIQSLTMIKSLFSTCNF